MMAICEVRVVSKNRAACNDGGNNGIEEQPIFECRVSAPAHGEGVAPVTVSANSVILFPRDLSRNLLETLPITMETNICIDRKVPPLFCMDRISQAGPL